MSRTKLPNKTIVQIWVRAGGRCQYPGCNIPLWKDDLNLAAMNRAYLAHIIADSPDGPRGDPILSEQLKSDPSNIILLCDQCHRRIDKEAVEEHPVELLRAYKAEHQARIELVTSLQEDQRTEILLFGTRIGERSGHVNFKDARLAVLPHRYPASEKCIRVDLSDIHVNENDEGFWDLTKTHIDRELSRYFGDQIGPSGKPINHLSVFALAPIPALIYLGMQLGDIRSTTIYQLHREPVGWQWTEEQDDNLQYDFEYSEPDVGSNSTIVINLSLSNPVRNADIEQFFGGKPHIYTLSIAQPYRDFLKSEEQLKRFKREWTTLVTRIQNDHGSKCEVHLLAAVPNSIAVTIGCSLIPKVDPRFVLYEPYEGSFRRAFVL